MDFKVTGTDKGDTACQMDIKIQGLTMDVDEALMQAKEGRMHILGEMLKTISKANADVKPHAPEVSNDGNSERLHRCGDWTWWKDYSAITKDTDTVITIEEVGEIGHIEISGTDREKINIAVAQINEITFVPVVGGI